MDDHGSRLTDFLADYPGVARSSWDGDFLAITFTEDLDGVIAESIWHRVLDRRALTSSTVEGRLKAAGSEYCLKAMTYSSPAALSRSYQPGTRDLDGEAVGSNVFLRICQLYAGLEEQITQRCSLHYNVWANCLRILDDASIELRDFARQGVLADRAIRVILRDARRLGWVEPGESGRRHLLSLSKAGVHARQQFEAELGRVHESWRRTLGNGPWTELARTLGKCIRPMAYEVPWGLTGYGPGDSSPTGGSHVPSVNEPYFLPAHGAEWPIVTREPGSPLQGEPLIALLAKVAARLLIDYGQLGVGSASFAFAAQSFGDCGITLSSARQRFGVTGNGRSGTERHLHIVTPAGRQKDRLAYLTPKGRIERDALSWGLNRVAKRWREELGDVVVDALQDQCDRTLSMLPVHRPPDPNLRLSAWFSRFNELASAK